MRDVQMLKEEKWKDRCERYFSSIAENEQKSNNTRRELLPRSDSASTKSSRHSAKQVLLWIKNLNIHGASYLGSARSNYAIIFWSFIILCGYAFFGLCIYQLLLQYTNQSSHFTMTASSRNEKSLDPSLSVTFCNLNVLKVSQLSATRFEKLRNLKPVSESNTGLNELSQRSATSISDMLKTTSLWKMLQNSLGDNLTLVLSSIEQEFAAYEHLISDQDIDRLYQSSLNGDLSSVYEGLRLARSEVLELGHAKNDMLRHCWIDGRSCLISESIVNPNGQQGNCITVKSSSSVTAFGTLSLLLDAQPYEYVGVTSPVPGFVVSVHDLRERHQEAQQLIVSPGHNLKLTLKEVTKYRRTVNCNGEDGYHQKICLKNCLEKKVVDLCGCSISFDSSLRARCRLNTPYEFFCQRSLNYLQKKNQLGCKCPERCSETHYHIDDSTGEWPSQFHSIHVERSLASKGIIRNSAQIKDTMVKVDIDTRGFHQKEYTEIYDINFLDLLWKVGGLSAIIIGMSVITVLEIIWLIGRCFVSCCKSISKSDSHHLKIQIEAEARSTWTNNHQLTREANRQEPPALPRRPSHHRMPNMLRPIIEEVPPVTNPNVLITNDDYDDIDHIYAQVWDPASTARSNILPDNNVNAVTNQLSRKRSNYNIKVTNKPVAECKRNYFLRLEGSTPLNHNRGSMAPHLVQTYSSQQTRLVTGSRPGIFYM